MIRQAVILCGGLGTRLGEITAATPKPLLPVDDGPFLDVLLLELGRHGIKQVLLLAGFCGDQVKAYAASTVTAARFGIDIQTVVEPEPAGTGGALWQARELLDDQFFMLNGDSWFDINLLELSRRLIAAPSAVGVVALRRLPDPSRYGVATLEGDRIADFLERPSRPGSGLVSGGVYVFRRTVVERLGPKSSIERDVMPSLAHDSRLLGQVFDGYFIDIGIVGDLQRARVEVPRRRRRAAAFLDHDGLLDHRDGHVGLIERLRWAKGAREAVRQINDAGFYVFFATTRASVARGFYREAQVRADHPNLAADLAIIGAHIDDLRYLPEHPKRAITVHRHLSNWRKAASGTLLDFMRDWPIDPSGSFFVSDKESRLAAAAGTGITAHLFSGSDVAQFVVTLLNHTG